MKQWRITGWHVFAALGLFFGAIALANAIFITLAVRSFPGETQKKSYDTGLKYNEVLIERAAQSERGWRAEITRAERQDTGGILELHIVDAVNDPLNALVVNGQLQRPAHEQNDVPLKFSGIGGGVYRAPIVDLAPGAWQLKVLAVNSSGDQFDIAARVIFE